MITIDEFKYELKPTIFPDKTSQIWHLPEEILNADKIKISWFFEEEREIIDLLSFRLLYRKDIELHIPYLPYARQDKEISNEACFNLELILNIFDLIQPTKVTALDVHNPEAFSHLPQEVFENILPVDFINRAASIIQPDFILFPDKGAQNRYGQIGLIPQYAASKLRDKGTGIIKGIAIPVDIPKSGTILVVDDICDGGATFIELARALKEVGNYDLNLYVTHGLFSKGLDHLKLWYAEIFSVDYKQNLLLQWS